MLQNKSLQRFLTLFSCISVLFCLSFKTNAQDTLLRPGTDTAFIMRLCDKASEETNSDSALKLFEKSLKMSSDGNFIPGAIRSLNSMSDIYFKKSDFGHCLIVYKKELTMALTPQQKAVCYHNIGMIDDLTGEYVQAAKNFDTAIAILQAHHIGEDDEPHIYAIIYGSIALLDADINQEQNMVYYLHKSEIIARKGHDYGQLVAALLNEATIYKSNEKFDSANLFLLDAQKACTEGNIKNKESTIDELLGTINLESKHYEKAIEYFKLGIDPARLKYDVRPDYLLVISSYGIGQAL